MGKQKKQKTSSDSRIGTNKKARHDYFVEEKFEAGIALQGWEVKSLREGHIQLTESYVLIQNSEAFLMGCRIAPLLSASTHIHPTPQRSRKLLLHRRELNKLIGLVERKGFALIPLTMYWKKGLVKVEIGLGKGKKDHDKRATLKERDWNRDKQRILRRG